MVLLCHMVVSILAKSVFVSVKISIVVVVAAGCWLLAAGLEVAPNTRKHMFAGLPLHERAALCQPKVAFTLHLLAVTATFTSHILSQSSRTCLSLSTSSLTPDNTIEYTLQPHLR
jgi:hypothetical protein